MHLEWPRDAVYVVIRLIALWDYKKSTEVILTIASLVTFAGSCTSFVVGAREIYGAALSRVP